LIVGVGVPGDGSPLGNAIQRIAESSRRSEDVVAAFNNYV
jgi:hypothetical protein